jgi:hypothetical protein
MRVANNQAALAFAALRGGRGRRAVRRRRARPTSTVSPRTLDRALATIGDTPAVRPGAVATARRRVARGDHPASHDVAEMVVRRAACDRLN